MRTNWRSDARSSTASAARRPDSPPSRSTTNGSMLLAATLAAGLDLPAPFAVWAGGDGAASRARAPSASSVTRPLAWTASSRCAPKARSASARAASSRRNAVTAANCCWSPALPIALARDIGQILPRECAQLIVGAAVAILLHQRVGRRHHIGGFREPRRLRDRGLEHRRETATDESVAEA